MADIIKQKYLFRAKCYDKNNSTGITWKFGCLVWLEYQPCVTDLTEEDNTYYYIQNREPNSAADWNLPYPTVRYAIPKECYDTITPYVGWNDSEGENIFVNDIIRYSEPDSGREFDCWATEHGILVPCSTEFTPYCEAYVDSESKRLIDFKIIGNMWDGPRNGFVFQDWIAWKGKEKRKE